MKKFRIWKSTGKPEVIEAKEATFRRTKNGLTIKFDDSLEVGGVVALMEVSEPETPSIRHEAQDD